MFSNQYKDNIQFAAEAITCILMYIIILLQHDKMCSYRMICLLGILLRDMPVTALAGVKWMIFSTRDCLISEGVVLQFRDHCIFKNKDYFASS